ncbi:hypothetical protein FDUTEX481_00209, partial [Tolypothrix sp. PCC 7601]
MAKHQQRKIKLFCTQNRFWGKGRALYKYLAPSSPNPFSPRRRGTKSLA